MLRDQTPTLSSMAGSWPTVPKLLIIRFGLATAGRVGLQARRARRFNTASASRLRPALPSLRQAFRVGTTDRRFLHCDRNVNHSRRHTDLSGDTSDWFGPFRGPTPISVLAYTTALNVDTGQPEVIVAELRAACQVRPSHTPARRDSTLTFTLVVPNGRRSIFSILLLPPRTSACLRVDLGLDPTTSADITVGGNVLASGHELLFQSGCIDDRIGDTSGDRRSP